MLGPADRPDARAKIDFAEEPRKRATCRGFELLTFEDLGGVVVEVQQSSLAHYALPGSSALWIGPPDARVHLGRAQVEGLARLLLRWVETGSFNPAEPAT